jgi:hypothetical protein
MTQVVYRQLYSKTNFAKHQARSMHRHVYPKRPGPHLFLGEPSGTAVMTQDNAMILSWYTGVMASIRLARLENGSNKVSTPNVHIHFVLVMFDYLHDTRKRSPAFSKSTRPP